LQATSIEVRLPEKSPSTHQNKIRRAQPVLGRPWQTNFWVSTAQIIQVLIPQFSTSTGKKLLSHETYTAIPSHIFPVNMKNQAIVLPWDE
jgi:hypothetical protein